MSSELEILEKIELYTRGRLSPAEASALEAQMELDPQLKKRVLASSIVDEIIVSHEAMKLKALMQKDMTTRPSKWRMYLSAVLLVVTLGGFSYFMLSKEKEAERVTAEAKLPLEQEKASVSEKETTLLSSKDQVGALPEKEQVRNAAGEIKEVSVAAMEQKIALQEKMENREAPMPTIQPYEKAIVQQAIVHQPTSKKTEVQISPCKGASISVDFYTVPSCAERETGELHIRSETIKEGTPPFTFLLDGRSATSAFDRLSSGTYRLLVKDAKGCTFESLKEVVVSSKPCKEKKEYAYNPEFDPSWSIPYDEQKEPKSFKVMDKGGKLFFQTAVTGNQPVEWKGESSHGLHLGAGLYFFYIEYVDGTLEEGSILVTR